MIDLLVIFIFIFEVLILLILLFPFLLQIINKIKKESKKHSSLTSSSRIRLINQLREAVEFLSSEQIGAIITIENNDNLDNLRTDGIKIDANLSAALMISIFNKNSPLHDGAIIIRNGRIVYASTYYKITKQSIDNRYGSRHRAALGISEVSDATTIVVSEETGQVSITKNSTMVPIKTSEFQEKLVFFMKE